MSAKYWEFFLSIEDDLERCTKYVEFCSNNYKTYSNEFAKIIMSASAEFENVAKDLCHLINPASKPGNIKDIYPIFFGAYPKFKTVEICIPRYKLSLQPCVDWTSSSGPAWWSNGYNKIKHERTQCFENANLNYAILSMAGLFTAILYYHHKETGGIEINYSRAPTLFDTVEPNMDTITYDIPI